MRGSLIALAALVGAYSVFFLGSMSACVVETVASDAGTTATTTPLTTTATGVLTCDAPGTVCDTCQMCAAESTCATLYTNCQNDPLQGCAGIANCVDGCVAGDPNPSVDCPTECCAPSNEGGYQASSVLLYVQAARCGLSTTGVCPNSCIGRFVDCSPYAQ